MVWSRLDQSGVAHPPGAAGRIPNFVGAEAAAERLASHPSWQRAGVIKCNPDKAQLPVRLLALAEGKRLYMAVPRIADIQPFYLLDPRNLTDRPERIVTSEGAARHAPKVGVGEMPPVDLVICGSVAVNRDGARIGKGAGYSDIEVALLTEAGLVSPSTILATTVHPLQIVNGPIPEAAHDFRVDLIVTPNEIVECPPAHRPAGLYWDSLDPAKVAAIPVLAARAATRSKT
ncbi:5-formyltetrahydrofolate cyclo-ligase [Micromonospora sp. NBC_01412]|uniref:5-formyltetrahydrofolate cyclo-ligase n=1 Tax=Micromonospora sp. NBC_01412 TaxID=2903590 RepID=UPI00386E5965